MRSTHGANLLQAIALSGSVTNFVRCRPEWFIDEEERLFTFMNTHFRTYNTIATIETLERSGFSSRSLPEEPVDYYFTKVQNRSIYNALSPMQRGLQQAFSDKNVDSIIDNLSSMLTTAREIGLSDQDVVNVVNEFDNVLEEHRDSFMRQGIRGISLGWDYLDRLTNGAQPGDVIVVVARPGMGKSYLLLHAAMKAWEEGRPILIGSMEMSNNQLAKRMLAIGTGMRTDRFTQGTLSTLGEQYAHQYIHHARSKAPCHLVAGNFRKSVVDMERIIRELSPDIAYVDAAYLLQPQKQKFNSNRRESIADVIEGLKSVAINTNIPIVVTVQFNRNVKKGKNTDIDLESIGETDTIGQIASVVIGVQEGRTGNEKTERRLSVIKNRDGDNGKFVTNFKFDPTVDFGYLCEITDDETTPVEQDEDVSELI